ncbi:MAG: DNA-binding protein [Parabacteroides sp.]|nr:DNA-binding protein [Parabacteroides sp.]
MGYGRMKYISAKEAAEKWGLTPRRVGVLCNEGRIEGAYKAGASWIIPDDVEKPHDARIKSGKYIKTKTEVDVR